VAGSLRFCGFSLFWVVFLGLPTDFPTLPALVLGSMFLWCPQSTFQASTNNESKILVVVVAVEEVATRCLGAVSGADFWRN
jgi:hypothetical protein